MIDLHWRHILPVAVIALGVFCTPCHAQLGQSQKVSSSEDVSESLEALKQRAYRNAFVVFKAQPSGKYVQFFNGGDSLYFDFTVKSVQLKGYSDKQQMGKVVNQKPDLSGPTYVRDFISSEQEKRLIQVLNEYNLNTTPKYQIGYDPESGNRAGYFKIIRGIFAVEHERAKTFLDDVFSNAYQLENYTIRVIEN
jgi:hypothetical protein